MEQEYSLADYKAMTMPSGYAIVRMGYDPYQWQIDAMDALAPDYSYAALRTCNESGKTSVCIATLILWHMENFPWSMTVTTSASNLQIREQLYPVLRQKASNWPGWKVQLGQQCRVTAPNGSRCISYSTDDPKLAEGFHTPNIEDYMKDWEPPEGFDMASSRVKRLVSEASLMIIVDESKGVKPGIFEAIWRCNANRHFFASSPDHESPSGDFYNFFHSDIDRFKTPDGGHNIFHCSYLDCPHIAESKVRRKKLEYEISFRGRNDAWVRSYAFGEFSESGKNLVFDMARVQEAMSGLIPHVDEHDVGVGIDLSGGRDATIIVMRYGNMAFVAKKTFEKDAIQLAKEILNFLMHKRVPANVVNVDNGGMGEPIIDYFHSKKYPVNRIDFGGTPKNPKKFLNVRAEMYFELDKRIRLGEVTIKPDKMLSEQFRWIEYGSDVSGGKLTIKPKKEMPASPDELDSLVMCYYGMQFMPEVREKEKRHLNRLSPTYVDTARQLEGSLLC